jgi:transmembrane sensor
MVEGQDLMRQIADAGARMAPTLSDGDVERLIAGASARRQRRKARRNALAFGAALALITTTLAVAVSRMHGSDRATTATHQGPAVPAPSRVLRLADGSKAVSLDSSTEISLIEEHADRVTLSLSRGRGYFDVTHRPTRNLVVRAGDVTITVLGTAFTVERVADRVGVSVERGVVRVEWGARSALVHEGESGWYPPLVVSSPSDPSGTAEEATHAHPVRALKNAPPRERPATPATSSAEKAGELLLAADNARLAGHPAQGAEFLRELLREHADDRRAPLAAFTLGRMLLMELRQPNEAAAAFAESRRLSPRGTFAEDAMAREIEALRSAGRTAEARALAREYLHAYPNGRRAAAMRATSESE